jgi:hypothetical protein
MMCGGGVSSVWPLRQLQTVDELPQARTGSAQQGLEGAAANRSGPLDEWRACVYSRGVRFLPRPSVVSLRHRADGRGTMAERDLTAREDRFIGLCLAAVAIIIVFVFIVTTS